jgi:thymidylate synthase
MRLHFLPSHLLAITKSPPTTHHTIPTPTGFQWRHFGAEYVDMHADYAGKGIDQLARAIQTIKSNPEDRRIIVSAW